MDGFLATKYSMPS